MLPSKTSIVVRLEFSEEYMLAEEIISLEFWLLGEGILWLGLRSVSDLQYQLRNRNLRFLMLRNFSFFYSCILSITSSFTFSSALVAGMSS